MLVAAVMVVRVRRMARRVMVQEIRSGSWPAVAAAWVRAVWVSWQAQSRAQISWVIPAGWRERRTWRAPRVAVFRSR
jgi:hypothetical protein